MGCIWAWHDPENGEPDYEVPDFAEWNDPQWVRWKIDQMGTIALHPQEVLDNMADVAHLNPVHGSTVEYFENEFRDHVVIQRQGGGHRTLVTTSGMPRPTPGTPSGDPTRSHRLYDTLMLITHTPVDDGAQGWHGLLVKSPEPDRYA
jgi:3-ketosteroid 9alpha-monooxygenase subunit A